MKCKMYKEITVEIRTQLKTVKITSNIFAVCSGTVRDCSVGSYLKTYKYVHLFG